MIVPGNVGASLMANASPNYADAITLGNGLELRDKKASSFS
jgi:hypothetical protein